MKWPIALLVALLIAGCGKQQEETYQPTFSSRGADAPMEFIVGIYPLHNPKHLLELYGPIVDSLNASMPKWRFRLEASRNYEEFEKKLFSGHFDFAMADPYRTLRSLRHGYHVFAKMGDDAMYHGIILVRKDSGITHIADLKGKRISYSAPTALAGGMMPQYYLQTHGIDVKRDVVNLYVGSHESSITNVLRRHVAAAATWSVPWKIFVRENPETATQLKVMWQTEALPNCGWVARDDVPPLLAEKVANALVGLGRTIEGRVTIGRLGISRFEYATNEAYGPVRQYLKAFSETVRHVEY
jgi:phosphonate transport system substrate-binding protein